MHEFRAGHVLEDEGHEGEASVDDAKGGFEAGDEGGNGLGFGSVFRVVEAGEEDTEEGEEDDAVIGGVRARILL